MSDSANEPDYETLIRQSRTFAEMLNVGREQRLRKVFNKSDLSSAVVERLIYTANRIYKPWPMWVLRIAAEVFSSHFSTVSKQTFLELTRAIHWLIFEAEIYSNSQKAPVFYFPTDLQDELFRAIGHSFKLTDMLDKIILEFETANLPPEKIIEIIEIKKETAASTLKFQKELFGFLENLPIGRQIGAFELIGDASKSTFDEEGRIRETTATPIYKRILESWIEIETFSGAAELCAFLDPVLVGGDSEAKLDRVKKSSLEWASFSILICQGTSTTPKETLI